MDRRQRGRRPRGSGRLQRGAIRTAREISCSREMREQERGGGYGEKTVDEEGANGCADAARGVARRHASGRAVWRVDDVARVGQADTLRRNQHLGAVAAFAQGEMRRLRAGKARAQARRGEQRRTLCGVGVSVDAAARLGGPTPRIAPAGTSMSVKPELAFDVCWEVYRGAREVLEAKRGMSAMDWKEATKYLWRPDFRPRLAEWVADFALAGQAALDGPECASRMVMFRLYYLGLAPYENARHFLGLSEQGWVNWSEEVRRRCGKELLRRGMFPPRRYFRNAA